MTYDDTIFIWRHRTDEYTSRPSYTIMALHENVSSSSGFSWYNGDPVTSVVWEENEPVLNYSHGFVPVLYTGHYFRMKALPPEEALKGHMLVCEQRLDSKVFLLLFYIIYIGHCDIWTKF